MDLDDPRIEAFGMLVEASSEASAAIERALAANSDLPTTWLGVLIRLGRTPGGEMRMTQLAREMTISTSGLTRLIDRIEQAGLVERRPCPTDRRGMLAAITAEGRATLAAVFPLHVDHVAQHYASHLSDAELKTLTKLLEKVRDGIRGSATPS